MQQLTERQVAALTPTECSHLGTPKYQQGEVAREFRVCEATVRRARQRGELGFLRIGDRVVYCSCHLAGWLR
jgi:hypothetical protein